MTPMQRVRARKWLGQLCAYATLVVVTLAICFPLMWALSTSLKPKSELSGAPTLVPHNATLENYKHLITGKAQYFGAALLGWACALLVYTRLQHRTQSAEAA